jgi:hypothetical protein
MDGAERFQRFECIGRGSFGDVYRGYVQLEMFISEVSTGPVGQLLVACRFDKVLSREVAIKVIELDDV